MFVTKPLSKPTFTTSATRRQLNTPPMTAPTLNPRHVRDKKEIIGSFLRLLNLSSSRTGRKWQRSHLAGKLLLPERLGGDKEIDKVTTYLFHSIASVHWEDKQPVGWNHCHIMEERRSVCVCGGYGGGGAYTEILFSSNTVRGVNRWFVILGHFNFIAHD